NSCVINYPQAESGIPDPAPFRIVLTDTVSVKLAGNARTGRRGQDLISPNPNVLTGTDLRSVSFRVPDDGARGARTSQGDIEVLRPLVAATAQQRSNAGGGTVTNLVDLESIPPIDLFGEAVRARRVQGDNLTLAIVELAPDAIVPEHRHPNEQLGMVISGDVTFTLDGETRHLGPGGTWRILSMKPHEV